MKPTTIKLIFLLLLVALPYATALNYEFVYDDHGQIVTNSFLDQPTALRQILSGETFEKGRVINGRRPFVLLTYYMDRSFWGLQPFGYHLTNLLLHLASVLGLFHLVRELSRRTNREPRGDAPALVVACLFGLHPVLIEAVQVPSFRPDVLYTLCTIAFLLCALARPAQRPAACIVFALGMLALWLGLCSKEAGVVAPALLFVMWLTWPATRPGKQSMLLIGTCSVALVAFYGWLSSAIGSYQALGHEWNGRALLPPDNVFTAPALVLQYARALLIPYPLIADHVIPPVESLTDVRFVAGSAILFLVTAALLTVRHKAPWLLFSLSWILFGFLPVANIIPLMNPFAERYAYFMIPGLAMLSASLLQWLPARESRHARLRLLAVGLIAAVYLGLTFERLQDWKNDYALWTHTTKYSPQSARAHAWLGLEEKRHGQMDEARAHFEKARVLNPREISAAIGLAILLAEQDHLKEAEDLLRESISVTAERAPTYWNLARVMDLQDRPDEAILQMKQALRLEPWNKKYFKALVTRLIQANRFPEALQVAERMLEEHPADAEASAAKAYLLQAMTGR